MNHSKRWMMKGQSISMMLLAMSSMLPLPVVAGELPRESLPQAGPVVGLFDEVQERNSINR
jgi:hypothetical protein